MTNDEYSEYWSPVSQGQFEITKKMLKLLKLEHIYVEETHGTPHPTDEFWQSIILTDKAKDTLTALAGPYGKAIWKMLEIKNGLAKAKS